MKNPIRFDQKIKNLALFSILSLFLFVISYQIKLSLAVPLLLLVTFIYFRNSYRTKIGKLAIKVGLLLVLLTVATYALINYSKISYYYLPVCVVPMLMVILFNDLRLAFVVSVFCAIETGAIISNNFILSVVYLIGGLAASLCVWQSRRRSQIILAGLIAGLMQALCFMLFFSSNLWGAVGFLRLTALPLLINGIISALIVVGGLPLFESMFSILTNISLLELSDFNHPLLRKMFLEAPGTYQHSLVVGNLAEVACEAIGANSLLARVGAYYHDIGKLEKAEYFSENQTPNLSKHDKILPSISKLIIVSHVKDGMELAKKYRLNSRIIDFIMQHHGTSLTYYFYVKALEGMEHEDDVKEEGFRYPGPKPQTKEIAIVHLADSIEAASRTLEEPTPARIEELVRKIVNNKFIDGQLDECELTLKDLEKIAATFVRILSAMYHSRIRYPKAKNGNNGN